MLGATLFCHTLYNNHKISEKLEWYALSAYLHQHC